MKTLPVAVQVYSVRDDAERDFKGTMQKIKEMVDVNTIVGTPIQAEGVTIT